MRILTNTVVGVRCRNTARFGFRIRPLLAGLRIVTATGLGFLPGAGLGWMMRRGALRHFITAAGRSSEEVGAGFRARRARLRLSMCARCTPLRWSHGSAEADSPRESAWAGSH